MGLRIAGTEVLGADVLSRRRFWCFGQAFDGSFLSPFTIPFIREAIQFLIKLKQCTIALSLNFDVPGLTT